MFHARELPERLNAGTYVLPVTVETEHGVRTRPVHGAAVGGPNSPCGDGTVLLLDADLAIVAELSPESWVRFVDTVDTDSEPFLFFFEHDGRRNGAAALVRAERWARDSGVWFVWSPDGEVTNHVDAFDGYDAEPETCEMCEAYDADGVPIAALACIDDATPEYRRVVEAELALEAMPND